MDKQSRSRDSPKRDNSIQSRNFSLVSYIDDEQLLEVLDKKNDLIAHWACAFHDMDEGKEPHWHILLKVRNGTYCNTVKNWFNGYTDAKGQEINTFCEVAENVGYCFRYLTHSNKADKDKYQYSDDVRIVDDIDYWQKFAVEPCCYEDKLKNALIGIATGKKTIEQCVIEYGRDFIIHYGHIKDLLRDIDASIFIKGDEKNV